jgi:hypothetical protein
MTIGGPAPLSTRARRILLRQGFTLRSTRSDVARQIDRLYRRGIRGLGCKTFAEIHLWAGVAIPSWYGSRHT